MCYYRKGVSNLDIGTEKEEKDNSKTAQSFLFWLAGLWVGEGNHSQRLSVCLAEFVYVVDRGIERSTHSAISQLFLLLFETGVCYTAQAGLEPVTLLLLTAGITGVCQHA